jgi:hypothetical protein
MDVFWDACSEPGCGSDRSGSKFKVQGSTSAPNPELETRNPKHRINSADMTDSSDRVIFMHCAGAHVMEQFLKARVHIIATETGAKLELH